MFVAAFVTLLIVLFFVIVSYEFISYTCLVIITYCVARFFLIWLLCISDDV